MELLTDRKKHSIFLSSRNLRHTQLILQKDIKTEVSCDLSVNISDNVYIGYHARDNAYVL